MHDDRYLSKIPDYAQSKEVSIFCSFWDPVGSCDLQTRIDGRSHEDHSDIKLVGAKECEVVVHYPRTYRILHKVYQRLCLDDRTYGKVVEEGCDFLLERGL